MEMSMDTCMWCGWTIQVAWRRYETRLFQLLFGQGAQIWLVYKPLLLVGVVVVVERYTPILCL